MNIIFFGSAKFGVRSLEALIASKHRVSCVVTQPDKQKGRGLTLSATEIKTCAQNAKLEIYQPDDINTAEALNYLKSFAPDLFVVVAYGQILSGAVLDIPQIFSLNIHASLLPKYRGAAPINWAIIHGEKTTGITIIKMTQKMDAGPIILQKTINIDPDDTSLMLEEKLSDLGARLLLEVIELIENGAPPGGAESRLPTILSVRRDKTYNLIVQDIKNISFAPKLKKQDGRINWGEPAHQIYNLIRGCLPWPGAFTYYKGNLLKIYKARVIPLSRYPVIPLSGTIIEVSKEGIVVATAKDNLSIEELQLEGKRVMSVQEFISGHKIKAGEILGKI